MMRSVARSCSVVLLGGWVVSAPTAPDDPLNSIGAHVNEPVDIAGIVVIDVSPQGIVITTDEEESGLVEVRNTLGGLEASWHLNDGPEFETPVTWAPDGEVIAFDNAAFNSESAESSGVRTLDLSDGSAFDVSNDPDNQYRDFFPIWTNSGAIFFLRNPVRRGRTGQAIELAWRVDGQPIQTAPVDVGLASMGRQRGAVLDDHYVLSVVNGHGTDVISVDQNGDLWELFESAMRHAFVSEVSPDGSWALITQDDGDESKLGPLVLASRTHDEIVAADVDALDAAFDPEGDLIAAVVVDTPGADGVASLALWDPLINESRRMVELDVRPVGIVWTQRDEVIVWGVDSWQVIQIERST